MVEERPKRRKRKAPAKKRPPKAVPATEEEQPVRLPEELPQEEVPAAIEPWVEEAPVAEERQGVPVEEVVSAAAEEEARPAPRAEPKPAKEPVTPVTTLSVLMSRPEFRQRVVQLVARKLR